MEAVRIFTHSVRRGFGNLGAALRLSAVPILVQTAVFLLTAPGLAARIMQDAGSGLSGRFTIGLMLAFLVATVSFLVIAVNWHRFVLMNEPVK